MKQKSRQIHLRFAVLAADVAILTVHDGKLLVRLAPVNRPPHFIHANGLPGGLIDPKETAEDAAKRLARSKGGLTTAPLYMEQLYTFSTVDRDPRGRVVAVTYLALVPWESLSPIERANKDEYYWSELDDVRGLAYDHDIVVATARERLRSRARYTTLVSRLMPKEFTLTELEHVYESILREDLDKRNFRKKILKLQVLLPLNRKRSGNAFRPAELYRFKEQKVQEIEIL